MTGVCLVLALLAAEPAFNWDSFLARLEATDRRDPKALLRLGEWCEKHARSAWAKKCYEMVIDLGEAASRDDFCEASVRVAKIEIRSKRLNKAYKRLSELLGKCTHAEANGLIRSIESQHTRQQSTLLQKGDRYFEKGSYKSALKSYESAYELGAKGPSATARIPEKLILGKLAKARDLLDDDYYQKRVLPVERGVSKCGKCGADGFHKCGHCKGRKTIPQRYYDYRARRYRIRQVPCPTCNRLGYQGCGECLGMGVGLVLQADERRALKSIVGKVRHTSFFKMSIDSAIRQVEAVLLRLEKSSTLNSFRAEKKPSYVLSGHVKQAIRKVPLREERVETANGAWRSARRDYRVGVNFLLHYACDFAHYLRHFDMLRQSKKPDDESLLAAVRREEDVLSPELISAFPDEGEGERILVKGTFLGYEPDAQSFKGRIKLRGEIDHNVNFYVWLPSARAELERFLKSPWRSRVLRLTQSYPFNIESQLAGVPRDHSVVLVGRFLRDRLGYPRNWFEVWNFKVGLSRDQEALYEDLSETVSEIAFKNMKLEDVARLLRGWFDLELDFPKTFAKESIDVTARDCPLGLLVNAIAGTGLGQRWYYEKGKAVVSETIAPQRSNDTVAVVSYLRETLSPESELIVQRSAGRDGPATSPTLPEDPAGLRIVAKQAVRTYDYKTAYTCFTRLAELETRTKRSRQIERLQKKYYLLNQLTKDTPVSYLTRAPELSEIVYRTSSGKLRKATVHVLRKGEDDWLIQEAYGARLTVPRKSLQRERPIEVADWRQGKLDELEKRRKEIAALGPAEEHSKINKLFILALFSKTQDLAGGADFLEQAITHDEFGWFLGAFFPDQSRQLTDVWRFAMGRAEPTLVASGHAPEKVDAEPPEESTEAPPPVDLEPVKPIPDSDDLEAMLRAAFEYKLQGSRYLQRAFRGSNAGTWRKQALTTFEEARRALQKVVAGRPSDDYARGLLRDVVSLIQVCSKDLGFFD